MLLSITYYAFFPLTFILEVQLNLIYCKLAGIPLGEDFFHEKYIRGAYQHSKGNYILVPYKIRDMYLIGEIMAFVKSISEWGYQGEFPLHISRLWSVLLVACISKMILYCNYYASTLKYWLCYLWTCICELFIVFTFIIIV